VSEVSPARYNAATGTSWHGTPKQEGHVASDEILATFFGDERFPVQWNNEAEKSLHWWYDDLHCPQPISPMWFDLGGWWSTCAYMYRRFGVPFGVDWVAKNVNGYVYSAVVPPDPTYAKEIAPYFAMVMPVYAERCLDWWETRLRPEIMRNFAYLEEFPYESASLAELMVLFEDALDIQERHFRIHWILNFSQFQASLDFQQAVKEVIGDVDPNLLGWVMVSDADRNWDSIRELWQAKERVKASPELVAAFQQALPSEILAALGQSQVGRDFLAWLDGYAKEYGNKAIYSHEYVYPTWRENPVPIVAAIQGYLQTDYSYPEALQRLRTDRDAAIATLLGMIGGESREGRARVEQVMERALRLMPLTPDHHFYIDQGTYARVRRVLLAIGRRLVDLERLDDPDDPVFLTYHELRLVSSSPGAIDARTIIAERRDARDVASAMRPREWVGTVSQWSLYQEPYKSLWGYPRKFEESLKEQSRVAAATVFGLPGSPGVVEGIARRVNTPEEFDQVRQGEILICKMTNPAWVVVFTKIGGLVTDTGGQLSHPAVVSREFGIPAVVGTTNATERISTGARVRVNGTTGEVEILSA
jgi:phosphohistidine swiveling domain-containing protein